MNPRLYRLSLFEEAAGLLHDLSMEQEMLIAHIGNIHLTLPNDLEPSLKPLINQCVTILRTDIPERPYLFRLLGEASAEANHD